MNGGIVIRERNRRFLSSIAATEYRELQSIESISRTIKRSSVRLFFDKICIKFFQTDTACVKQVFSLVKNQKSNVDIWIDRGTLGFLAVLIKIFFKSKIHIHMFHHNNEYKYLNDMLSTLNKPNFIQKIKNTNRLYLAKYQQKYGMLFSDKNYFLSTKDCADAECNNYFLFPPTWPNSFSQMHLENAAKERSDPYVLIVGSPFFANIHGFNWYIQNVSKKISCKTYFVGRNLDTQLPENENVKFIGYADDLIKYYLDAALIAIPIFLGSGVKIKLIEALNLGCKVISTEEGATGVYMKDKFIKSGQLIVSTKENFISMINQNITENDKQKKYMLNSFSDDKYFLGAINYFRKNKNFIIQ